MAPDASSEQPDDDPGELPPDPFGPGDPPGVSAEGGLGAVGHGADGAATGDPTPTDPLSALLSGLGATGAGGGTAMGGLGAVLGDFASMLGRSGAAGGGWEATRQLAAHAATDGGQEANVDPVARVRLESFAAIARPHVEELTGVVAAPAAHGVDCRTRGGFAHWLLEALRPLIEAPMPLPQVTGMPAELAPLAMLFAQMAPSMRSMSFGSMAGRLARELLAAGELGLPPLLGAAGRVGHAQREGTLVLVPANIDAFAASWQLDPDTVRMHTVITELCAQVPLSMGWLRGRVTDLLDAATTPPARIDFADLSELLDGAGADDPSALLADPSRLLGALRSPDAERAGVELAELRALVQAFTDTAAGAVAARVLGGQPGVAEARRRARQTPGEGMRLADELLGATVDRARAERAAAFTAGVVDRAGPEGLSRLWIDAAHLPTPSELAAPGLWLARIEL